MLEYSKITVCYNRMQLTAAKMQIETHTSRKKYLCFWKFFFVFSGSFTAYSGSFTVFSGSFTFYSGSCVNPGESLKINSTINDVP